MQFTVLLSVALAVLCVQDTVAIFQCEDKGEHCPAIIKRWEEGTSKCDSEHQVPPEFKNDWDKCSVDANNKFVSYVVCMMTEMGVVTGGKPNWSKLEENLDYVREACDHLMGLHKVDAAWCANLAKDSDETRQCHAQGSDKESANESVSTILNCFCRQQKN
ncbi:hypothetical protein R5R35_009004 [Gryllus longicercus]|uniref:Odorant binding protein n=1 Tax=Gryllus longicercus TaxID=2509291 RepID=A0AAN9VSL9_9ORTH